MACILLIESSSTTGSAALSVDGQCMDLLSTDGSNKHAATLSVLVNNLLIRQRKNDAAVDAVAVSKGPGSYTGLRIGVSLSKGLAFGWGCPLIAVDTCDAMVNGFISSHVIKKGDFVAPMIDARRMEVYTAMYDHSGNRLEKVQAMILDASSYADYRNRGKVHFFGNGASKTKDIFNGEGACIYEGDFIRADNMAALAENAYQSQQFEDLAYFEPFYLKDFVAIKAKNKVLNNK